MGKRFSLENRTLIGVFLLSLSVRTFTALPQQQPHYFDAYYYYDVAENLHLGRGFVVDFIWNYLEAPESVTHPSNLYWMPLSSMVAWLPFTIFGASYHAAQIPFIALSSLLPVIAYWLSYRIYGKRQYAFLAAILTTFAPFYMKYWASPDNFAPFAVTGALSLIALYLGWHKRQGRCFLVTGVLIGLSHLARADGFLLWTPLLVLMAMAWLRGRRMTPDRDPSDAANIGPVRTVTLLSWISLAVAGYLVVMVPWFYRNWTLIGAPMSSHGIKTVFVRSYPDVFSYYKELTLRSYLAWGWGNILRSKLGGAIHNLAVVVGALQFHLAPLAIIGLWQLRRRREYAPFYIYAAALYLAMTLIFTFPSTHASMLHSTGALLPFLYVAAIPGIDTAVGWIARRRRTWHPRTAQRVFRVGLTAIVVLVSLFNYCQGVFLSLNPPAIRPLWNEANTGYLTVSTWLAENAEEDALIMVVDPPAYYYLTHRPSIVTPNEEIEGLLAVARRYGVDYLVLEYDHVASLDGLYHGDATHPLLQLRHAFEDSSGSLIQIYEIKR